MATTANAIIRGAFGLLGIYNPNETPTAPDAQSALTALNNMLGQWSLMTGAIPTRIREVFDTVSGQGTPSNPYTIGPGGDFNTSRPMRIDGAAVLLTQSQPNPVEVPIPVLTNDAYDAIQVKELSNNQATALFYQPSSPLGRIYLWPIPNVSTNDLVLYRLDQLGTFPSLSASYDMPIGGDEAAIYNLAVRLADTFAVAGGCPASVARIAANSFNTFKRANLKLADLPQEIPNGNRRYGYNINTGNM